MQIIMKRKNLFVFSVFIITFIMTLLCKGHLVMANSTVIDYTLDNGLGVVLVHDPTSPIISARTYVRAGSIDEAPHLGSGLSHYLEHIVAGGSTSVHDEPYYKQLIAELGGAYNAYTTLDHTSYYINTTSLEVEKAITTLYEWMFHCTINTSEFEREKGVIVKEIEKNNADLGRQFYQMSQKNTFKVHPIQHPVIGYLESFKAVKRDELIHYYQTHYVPSNMVLVIGGNFDIDTIKSLITTTFGTISSQASPTRPYLPEPRPFHARHTEKPGDTTVTYFSIRFPTTTLFSDDLYALDLLEYILVNGNDSIMYKTLVEEKKLAYSINGASYTPLHTDGYFEISAETSYDSIPELKKEIYAILTKIKQGKISKSTINKGKKQKLAEDILTINHIEDKVTRYGIGYLYSNSPYFYDHYIKGFEAITKKDIQKTAKHYLSPDNEIVTILHPRSVVENGSNTNKATTLSSPKSAPPIQKLVLNNGITLLLKHDPTLPKTFAQIMTLGGIRAETKESNGIGVLLSDLLGTASKAYSKSDILTQIEGNGAHLGASMGNNTLYYTLYCLSDDFDELLPLFLDTFYFPIFPDDEITESKRQLSKQIEKRHDNWYDHGSYHFNRQFFGDHPYGLPLSGELASLKSISSSAIVTHHSKLVHSKKTVISIMGDFNSDAAIKTLTQFFKRSSLNLNGSFLTTSLPRKAHHQPAEFSFPIDQEVTGLFMGFDGVSINNTVDSLKLDLLDSVLSGMSYPSGRLHNLLREEGLVYMVHANVRPGVEPGVISVIALTSADKLARVKSIIAEQITSLQTTVISDQEFKEGLAQLRFYYDNKNASLDQLIVSTALDELYGKGYDFSTLLRDQINQLTKEDIIQMAKKYLKHPQTVVVSKKD
jgi:zinc protease